MFVNKNGKNNFLLHWTRFCDKTRSKPTNQHLQACFWIDCGELECVVILRVNKEYTLCMA